MIFFSRELKAVCQNLTEIVRPEKGWQNVFEAHVTLKKVWEGREKKAFLTVCREIKKKERKQKVNSILSTSADLKAVHRVFQCS